MIAKDGALFLLEKAKMFATIVKTKIGSNAKGSTG